MIKWSTYFNFVSKLIYISYNFTTPISFLTENQVRGKTQYQKQKQFFHGDFFWFYYEQLYWKACIIFCSSAFEGEGEHEGAGGEVVEGADVDVGVVDFEVEEAEVHLELDGELHVAQEDVEAHAHGVAEVVGLQADDALVGAVAVFAQGGEVETVADAGGEVGTEVAPALGAEFEFQRYVAVDGFDIAPAFGQGVGVEVGGLPGIGDLAGDECDAWEEAQVEPVVEAQVADDGDVEACGIVGGDALEVLAEEGFVAVFQVEHRLCVAYLDAVVQQAGVEFAEVADLGLSGIENGELKIEKGGA